MVQVIFCYLYHCCFYRERIGKEIKNTENGSPYCFFGVFAIYTVDRLGRKTLMLTGSIGLAGIYTLLVQFYIFPSLKTVDMIPVRFSVPD